LLTLCSASDFSEIAE